MPGHAQPGRDPRDREVIDDQSLRYPPRRAAGELRPLSCSGDGVFAPVVSAVITPVAPDPHQQRRGAVAERLMRQGPREAALRGIPSSAGTIALLPRLRMLNHGSSSATRDSRTAR